MAIPKPLRRPSSPPIPSYEEATTVTNPLLGTQQSPTGSSRMGYYQPPYVQSVRSSEDSLCPPRQSSDSSPTSLDSDTNSDISEGLRREVDGLDYDGEDFEMEELDNGSLRRRRRRRTGPRWKWLQMLRLRVGKWKKMWTWRRPYWLEAGLPRWQCPDVPETWRPGIAVIARLVGLLVLIALGYALFMFAIVPNARNGMTQMYNLEDVRLFAQGAVDGDRIRDYLKHVTSFDHVAGSEGSYYLAEWTKDLFWKAGMDEVRLDEYQVYLNYPKEGGRRVAIISPPELQWEAKLEEEPAYPNPSNRGEMNTLVFHGHSKSGNVSGPLIYFNYGSKADYKSVCLDSGINCRGAIGLVKYYGSQGDRSLKVKAAEEWGIKGVLIYSDPAEDGFMRGDVWPEGRWRPSDGVQRGAVSLMSWVIGDVLTPGWASTADAKRVEKENNPGLVKIPSLPLAWRDAQKLLQSLKGHGQRVPPEWFGAVPDVEWWSGDQSSPVVLLQNEQDEVDKQKIFNVMGTIEGMESGAKSIIVGNHRDSWCFGAGDPFVLPFQITGMY
jgi:N-acetylated-alpha-linked acidic dipeptidase